MDTPVSCGVYSYALNVIIHELYSYFTHSVWGIVT